ncbi:hypothetical protein I0C86_39955 [Plantactinospora sp. S1510]|uniref:Uncharacterized protein n=1 Tax=Plantactinospora alkalitolerans TaxID=2789879 RepID=A0ABS0HA68_9ACTN|nr:hypothetical protein [Plantactinospora alkalitolerans]MBF9135054.1 hypothetical protein [Plantactinospora alkalitolerans]
MTRQIDVQAADEVEDVSPLHVIYPPRPIGQGQRRSTFWKAVIRALLGGHQQSAVVAGN